MKYQIINQEDDGGLTLIFLGWGTDPHSLTGTVTDGRAIALWDYTDMSLPEEVARLASESQVAVDVIGWSMGVWAAEATMTAHPEIRWGRKRAFCGTAMAIDSAHGVPERIARLTAVNWDEANRRKFNDKMFVAETGDCSQYASRRDAEEQKNELLAIIEHSKRNGEERERLKWDESYVGGQDRIIDPKGQENYWGEEHCDTLKCENEMGHFPFARHKDLRMR